MKPLKIALVCKNENSTRRDNRAMGYFSYAVPEFTWNHIIPSKNFILNTRKLESEGYDLIFHEDYPYGDYVGNSIPIIFLSIDSTLSKQHFDDRFKQAQQSDLILVDHDDLNRFFNRKHSSVIQFPYCVNDKIFFKYSWENETTRSNDIAFHCSSSAHAGSDERKRIRRLLNDLSIKHNWSYRSGVLPLEQYAESFRTSKIVVNQSRTPINRPHRIFDAMACGAMVASSELPKDLTDGLKSGIANHCEFYSDNHLEETLIELLKYDWNLYKALLENGYNLVMNNHTWSIRSKQLREIINKEFGI